MSKRMTDRINRLWESVKDTEEYLETGAVIEFTEEMLRQMEIAGVSRAELARRLNVNAAYITKILRGDYNYTLKNMARVAHALGTEFKIRFQPHGTQSRWLEYASTSFTDNKRNDEDATDCYARLGAHTSPQPRQNEDFSDDSFAATA